MNKRKRLIQEIKGVRRELREIERSEIGKLVRELKETFITGIGPNLGKQISAYIKYCKAHGISNMMKRGHPHGLRCVVCGQPMEAQRISKKTCSNRCRLRLSRSTRAARKDK